MTRIETILLRARDTLSDPNKHRWTDEQLLRLLDDAQKTIVLQARLLRTTKVIRLVAGQAEYALPTDAHRYIRVLDDSKQNLKLVSHEQADTLFGTSWELEEGDPVEAIIYDKSNLGTLKVYPIPTLDSALVYATTDRYGFVESIDTYVVNSSYGVVADFSTDLENVFTDDNVYGVLTDMADDVEGLKIYYLKKPSTISSVSDTLEINDVFDRAMKYYITGIALRDDKDTQNRQIGNEELQFFQVELNQALKDSAQDGVQMHTQYSSSYIGAFD
jgi:hypothetical protein